MKIQTQKMPFFNLPTFFNKTAVLETLSKVLENEEKDICYTETLMKLFVFVCIGCCPTYMGRSSPIKPTHFSSRAIEIVFNRD